MGFLDTLRRVFAAHPGDRDNDHRQKLARAWGLNKSDTREGHGGDDETVSAPPESTGYDRRLWIKKLTFLLEEKLPIPDQEWHDFLAEAYALGYDRAWVAERLHSAFEQLIRRSVSDRVVTPAEHDQIEAARAQIGLGEAEAETILKRVVAEAERVFGGRVEEA